MIGLFGALNALDAFDEALEWQLDDPIVDDEPWVVWSAEEAPTSV